MALFRGKYVFTYLLLTSISGLSGCEKENMISYQQTIRPIIEKNCVECHVGGGVGITKSGFNVSNYDSIMQGTRYGPVIKPGDSVSSTLVRLIENRADPSLKMPHGNRPMLSKQEIKNFKDWINQGAKNN